MKASQIILNYVVAALKKKVKRNMVNLNNILYLMQYIQNISTSTCNQHTTIETLSHTVFKTKCDSTLITCLI